ncbi:hypothetical protein [Streptomyces sp. KL2]|uniref:hypothetical protein n=1 Tax=Streptomyces sp. KL2 TaxID=3050126 RepID=UPI00397AA3E2
MSHNQPPPQPGPYGQQPQPPYGGPQPGYGGPQPGYGHPQQPGMPPQGQPGYGGPQPGYGHPQQPGFPQQGGWGQPGYPQQPGAYMPPPPPGGGKGKTIGALVAVLAVVGLAVGGYFVFSGGGGSDIADDGPHKLIAPETVLGGEYRKAGSGGLTDSDVEEFEQFGVEGAQGVGGNYTSGEAATQKSIQFQGAWGKIDDPEAVIDAMFSKLEKEADEDPTLGGGGTAKLVGEPEKVSPAGLENAVMKCQAIEFTGGDSSTGIGGKGLSVPFCIWGDHSTVAYGGYSDVSAIFGGKGLSLDGTADIMTKLRNDVRVKAD